MKRVGLNPVFCKIIFWKSGNYFLRMSENTTFLKRYRNMNSLTPWSYISFRFFETDPTQPYTTLHKKKFKEKKMICFV